jgi:glycyl-tRNA synthetase beta chain
VPEFFLELFSEEIPARMQARAAEDLVRLVTEALAPLKPAAARSFYGPRRIAMAIEVTGEVAASSSVERGPRASAPEQALAGFLRKHGATRQQIRQEGDFWVLEKASASLSASELIATVLPALFRRFPWPKSMRWGGTSLFTWVRPLRRIVCLLDGKVVPFSLADGTDDGHGLASGDLTEGHRFLAPGAFAVTSCADWQEKLREHKVLTDAGKRRQVIADALSKAASESGVTVVDDPGLLDEVAGLVEWPVVLIGWIDEAYMDLPPEVMQVSMRVNQRYFALRNLDGSAAPYFAFAANIEATDSGAVIIAGNERVLRARFSDARHFWDLDRKTPLAALVEKLNQMTFHAKLGSQGDRSERIASLAEHIAPLIHADAVKARRAGELCKADLLTGMVGEFPELQGVMGGYYAQYDYEALEVADAIRDHYMPKGPADAVPTRPESIAIALADKIDSLAAFFAVDEKPTGSSDPYALRRAALGIVRIIRERGLRIELIPVFDFALAAIDVALEANLKVQRRLALEPLKTVYKQFSIRGTYGVQAGAAVKRSVDETGHLIDVRTLELLEFIADRLRVQLRTEGARHDVLTAVFAAGSDDDIVRLLARTEAVANLLGTDDGANLFGAYRRAANILRIEEKKDGPHNAPLDATILAESQEIAVADVLDNIAPQIDADLAAENYAGAMSAMASLRAPLDAFFDKVTVNDSDPKLRLNRLRLLFRVRATMDRIADFSKIEG